MRLWRPGGKGLSPAARRRVQAALPILALGVRAAGRNGDAAADLAGAGLLATDALAAGIVHELNNLLAALGFQLESLRNWAGAENPHLIAIDRLVSRGTGYGQQLLGLVQQGSSPGWLPVTEVLEQGLAYLGLVWYGKHMQLAVTGPVPAGTVACPVALWAWRLALRFLAATAPRGWSGAIHLHRRGGLLAVTVAPLGGGHPELEPGTGLQEDAGLRSLGWLLTAVGGDAAAATGVAPVLTLWLPYRPDGELA